MTSREKSTEEGAPGRPPSGRPYLSVLAGRHAGRLYPLEPGRPCLLGRSSECNPRFPSDLRISLIHASVTAEGEHVLIQDMSKNGTNVGGRLISRERAPVHPGEYIVLSSSDATLRLEWLSDEEVQHRIEPFIDALTRCWRPRHLRSRLADLLESPEDIAHPLSTIMVDIDLFGKFNKEHGQNVGNEVLRSVASCLRTTVADVHPAADVARDGGEEFLLLVPRCDDRQGRELAEEARRRIAALALAHAGQILGVTASFGGATRQPTSDMSLDHIRDLADVMMRKAKKCGRNRVLWEGDPSI